MRAAAGRADDERGDFAPPSRLYQRNTRPPPVAAASVCPSGLRPSSRRPGVRGVRERSQLPTIGQVPDPDQALVLGPRHEEVAPLADLDIRQALVGPGRRTVHDLRGPGIDGARPSPPRRRNLVSSGVKIREWKAVPTTGLSQLPSTLGQQPAGPASISQANPARPGRRHDQPRTGMVERERTRWTRTPRGKTPEASGDVPLPTRSTNRTLKSSQTTRGFVRRG